jgi:chaperonin GroES
MKLKPLGDKIVVKRLDAESKTAGGIVLPDTAKERPQRGKVVAVGTGRTTESGKVVALTVKVGDEVVFTSYAGTEVKVGAEELMVMSESDVLAIID